MEEDYNDKSLRFFISTTDRPIAHSCRGRQLDSNCVNKRGMKKLYMCSELNIRDQSFDDVRYFNSRLGRLPDTNQMINAKYLNFIDHDDYN